MDIIVSASRDHTIMVWELSTDGRAVLKRTLLGPSPVLCISFSPDNMYIASASEDKTVRIWELSTGDQADVFEGHSDLVNSVAWSPDGTCIVSASDDKTVRVWGVSIKSLC
jgi:WD40 repeat protein